MAAEKGTSGDRDEGQRAGKGEMKKRGDGGWALPWPREVCWVVPETMVLAMLAVAVMVLAMLAVAVMALAKQTLAALALATHAEKRKEKREWVQQWQWAAKRLEWH